MAKIWHELGPFTVFDVETTGMSPVHHRIVQIAAVRVEVDGSRAAYDSLVNPGCPIPLAVTRIHHITDSMVVEAPRFSDVGYRFLDFADGSTLVAHNARFDLGFLQESLARAGLPLWKGRTLDSLALARKAFPGLPSYALQNLRTRFNLEDTREAMMAHRADADVEWTVQLLARILDALLAREETR